MQVMQLDVRIIHAGVLLCIAATGAFLAGTFMVVMIGKINRKRPEGERESYFGFTLPKLLRIVKEYRNSYPGGLLHVWCAAGFIVVVSCMIGVGVTLGIIG
jgi:hypothetical protein